MGYMASTKWTTVGVQILPMLSIAVAIKCDLFMAESTIPIAGLGVFSVIERNPGDIVGYGDRCIPILDLNDYTKRFGIRSRLRLGWRSHGHETGKRIIPGR
mmetsp:Transcript_27705/g.67436  ORF Transcript_27705/g.67436 Transcript_27705/m.67436 type:complete len:101 (+) Transcript_27705:191-493(+)